MVITEIEQSGSQIAQTAAQAEGQSASSSHKYLRTGRFKENPPNMPPTGLQKRINKMCGITKTESEYLLSLEGRYAEIKHPVLDNVRTGKGLKPDVFHDFDKLIDNFGRYAHRSDCIDEDCKILGIVKDLYQIEGSLGNKKWCI